MKAPIIIGSDGAWPHNEVTFKSMATIVSLRCRVTKLTRENAELHDALTNANEDCVDAYASLNDARSSARVWKYAALFLAAVLGGVLLAFVR